jgi:hypothetical protein
MRGQGNGYQRTCRSCCLEAKRLWREANPTINRERALRYYHEHKDEVLRKKYKAYWSNPVEARKVPRLLRARKPELYNETRRKYDREHKRLHRDFYAQKAKAREALKLKAVPAWSNKQYICDMYMLAKLVTEFTGVKYHVDHIVPLRSSLVCGFHSEHNLQVIPQVENGRKANRYWPDMP